MIQQTRKVFRVPPSVKSRARQFNVPKAGLLRFFVTVMASRTETIFLSFGDADPAGVVFYPRALALAHAAVENLVRYSAVGWEGWFASRTHASPLRRAEAEFFRPLRPGEQITTRAEVEKVGTSSVTFRVDFSDSRGDLAATVRTTHVMIEKATGCAVALDEKTRAALLA